MQPKWALPLKSMARYLTTWNDKGGGGITNQYEIDHDGGKYDILLMHGNDKNKILSDAAVTDGVSLGSSSYTPPETPQQPTDSQVEAKTRAQEYSKMSKADMNAAYDKLRAEDPAKAATEGMKMHKAYFKKTVAMSNKKAQAFFEKKKEES